MRAAGIFFVSSDSVLLLQRGLTESSPGTWGLPGGEAHLYESDWECARRETFEECGKYFEGTSFDHIILMGDNFKWTTFLCKSEEFSCVLSHEHTAYKWVKLDELDSVELYPKLKKSLSIHLDKVYLPRVGSL